MIALRAIRLVGWHFFQDSTIPIGEATLFAGDNGSGKSTIIDAIQYALAANLTRIRFNAAATERRAGRTLEGYVRGKTGVESGEYLRDDAVAHVMLEFLCPEGTLCAGICVEAYRDDLQQREFPWIAPGLDIAGIAVLDAQGANLPGRLFRDSIRSRGGKSFETKREYTNDLTDRLGVYRRNVEFNPYLDALLRSVSFSPLISIDRFVCDFILEDRPVDVSAMKGNLLSYKEAEREALDVERKIQALASIISSGEEWAWVDRSIVFQEYLRLRVDRELAEEAHKATGRRIAELEREIGSRERILAKLETERKAQEALRQDYHTALARNDQYLLRRNLLEKRSNLSAQLDVAKGNANRYETLRKQCEAILGRKFKVKGSGVDIEEESPVLRAEHEALVTAIAEAKLEARENDRVLSENLKELEELERGSPRYPEPSVRLKAELEKRGIRAWIFADLLEVNDVSWQNALEGWLNTLRFAVLVEPARFREALGVYDSAPREVAGVALPNLDKMRDSSARKNSLAKLVMTESPYARIYADYLLGTVYCATLDSLRDYERAVTKECMRYSSYTATRMREDVYARWYLGASARERRKEQLRSTLEECRRIRARLDTEQTKRSERKQVIERVLEAFTTMRMLAASLEEFQSLPGEIQNLEAQIAAIDTSGIDELQDKLVRLGRALDKLNKDINAEHERLGAARGALLTASQDAQSGALEVEKRSSLFHAFLEGREALRAECEAYYAERLRASTLKELAAKYETAIKGLRTRLEGVTDCYKEGVRSYNSHFNALVSTDPTQIDSVREIHKRYVDSELPVYREKIAKARADAERQFKEHFVARLNEYIEEARESFREINETLREIAFGRDQYRFTLEERSDRRGQLEVIRKAADITAIEDGLFAGLDDGEQRRTVEALFEKILRNDLDSNEVRQICDYRTYFSYDIRMRDLTTEDPVTRKPYELSLSKVIREKSGGEAQTPYYVAIAASFYRFYKDKPESRIRLVLFDEAFNRMDDERIGQALHLFRRLGMQVITAVPTEKLETIAPWMDTISLVVRHGYSAKARAFRAVGGQAEKVGVPGSFDRA